LVLFQYRLDHEQQNGQYSKWLLSSKDLLSRMIYGGGVVILSELLNRYVGISYDSATSGAGTAYPHGASAFTSVLNGVRVARSFVFLYNVL